jgi:putative SOS response-associated peptidase YedK
MCGRFVFHRPVDEIRAIFGTVNPSPNLAPTWNMAPTRLAPVVRRNPDSGERHLDLLRWGLLPHWAKDPAKLRQPINARSETAATAPMFRDALVRRRCIVPADAFYEWHAAEGGKLPYAIARADGAMFAFAGLWEGWRGPGGEIVRSFVILTTQAAEPIRFLHERMPVVLEPADWPLWLGEQDGDVAPLMRTSAATLRIWPVSARVNNVRNDDPSLLTPLGTGPL